jgi:long-chain fatty acid transport protein
MHNHLHHLQRSAKRYLSVFVVVGLMLAFAIKPDTARAGGFQLNEMGARAMAMAFAVVSGEGADATTIFYNPAGMVFLRDGLSVTIGATGLLPGAKFTGPTNLNRFETSNLETWGFVLPHLYVAYKVPQSDLAFGLGVFAPFGAGTRWNETWVGSNVALRTYVQTITINPTVAYAFFDKKLSIAIGGTFSLGEAELQQRVLNFSGVSPILDLKGNGNAISFNAAAIYEPIKGLKIGGAYRHNINMKYDGQAKFTLDAAGTRPLTEAPGGLQNLFVNGGGGTALNLPFDSRLGVSYKFDDFFVGELGLTYVGWSSYDTLRIRFDKAPGNPSVGTTLLNPRNYRNSFTIHAGGELTPSDVVKVRFGMYFDQVPVEAQLTQPTLPDADRLGFTAGVGIKFSPTFSADIGYLFVYGLQREVKNSTFKFDGIYNSWANALALTFHLGF